MNILILSGIYPQKNQPIGGSFITKRVEKLKFNNECDLYKITNKYSEFIRILKKNKNLIENNEEFIIDNVKWNNVNIKINLFSLFLKKISNKIYYKLQISEIEKKIDMKRYNIIQAHWAYPTGYIAQLLAEKYDIPYVITCHGSDIHTIPQNNLKIKKYTIDVLERANKVIFVSETLKKDAIKLGYSGQNAEVIYNGVDLENFGIDMRKFNEKSNNIKNKKIIGYVGRLEYIKGADRLPRIFELINNYKLDTEFMIIGNGSLKEKILLELNEKNIKYKFFENINHNELSSYMNLCDVIIVPSRNESFCCVALEAQASGCNVIATDVGGISEALGGFGGLVRESNYIEQEIAIQTIKALSSKLNIKKVRKRLDAFSWDETVKKELEVYEKLILFKGDKTNEST